MKEVLKKILPAPVYGALRQAALWTIEQSGLFWEWLKRTKVRTVNFLTGGQSIPPSDLVFLVAGTKNLHWFLKSGKLGQRCLVDVLKKNDIDMRKMNKVLDFGCGVGRVIRHFRKLKGPKFYGTDYNPLLIEWCRRKLKYADFSVNNAKDKLKYGDNTFDFLYALSIFTHLPEPEQDFWINELARITRPGGYLFITVHGEYHLDGFPEEAREKFNRGEMSVFGGQVAGTNMCNTFHPYEYMNTKFAPHLELVDYVKEGALGNPRQDVYLFKKKTVKD